MKIFLTFIFLLIFNYSFSQNPAPALVGYWHNWQDPNAQYIQLTQTDSSYNIIEVAFATPAGGTTYNMSFVPDVVSQQTFILQVDSMRNKNKKVLISIGGANSMVTLNDTNQMNIFVNSMINILTTYHFDGIDIDLEGGSVTVTGGTIANPIDAKIINLIKGIKKLMTLYRNTFQRKMILTMAPETAFVQGGMAAYGSIWGAYLPVIHALRDSIEILQVQLYNSGSMFGIDGQIYYQGTADFILSQTEAVIHGFNTSGGYFQGLRPDQIAVSLPACSSAAGGGYIDPDTVKRAVLYILGKGPKPASYTLLSTYPALRGMMTWSINWDNNNYCHPRYEYARNFDRIFKNTTVYINNISSNIGKFELNQNFPNPFNPTTKFSFSISKPSNVKLRIFDASGREVVKLIDRFLSHGTYEVVYSNADLSPGVYFYQLEAGQYSKTRKMVIIK
jgi:chitinase